MSDEDEKINLDLLTKNYKVEDVGAFEAYLKDVWTDLYSRITKYKTEPKESMSKAMGLSKVIFNNYYNLPGIIGDRLFKVFAKNKDGTVGMPEFIIGMKTLFYEDFERNAKFIFDFYDFDDDKKITKEDIRVVLSYITLTCSDGKKIVEKNKLSYNHRLTSQEEISDILNKCFNNKYVKNDTIDFSQFKFIIENINSDIYLMIYLFLLEKKPFTNKNIESYNHYNNRGSRKESPKKEKKLLASHTKNANVSPYRRFHRKSSSINIENLDLLSKKSKSPDKKSLRKGVNTPKNIISLKPFDDSDNKIGCSGFKRESNKIDLKRVDELTTARKIIIRDSDSPLKPAFKQSGNVFQKNSRRDNNIQIIDNEEEENDSSNDSSLEGIEDSDREEDEINYQGKLYKFINGKFKELWFKLVYKDLYYYKNKNEKVHRGMHNLSGLFLKTEGLQIIQGKKMYCFSIAFSSKNRLYYCDNEDDYNKWVEVLKKATGYTNLLDIYEVKQKLGKGKFGLVKLAINKETKEKVSVKIMKKSSMDNADLELVRTEIEILKICQHPYIIKLYDVFENIDYIYIIMEYCSGGDLFSFIKSRQFMLKEEKVVVILYKLCKAVYYVHSYGIAHRDLKTENILLTRESEDADIRLVDFGLSKIVGPNEKCTEPYGTLTYCAPEIILDKPYLKTVDSWSIGVITYLMLSGSLPFTGKDEHEIAKNVVYSKVDFEKKPIWKNISKEAKDFICKLLEKDAKKRIDMKTALEHPWFKKFGLETEVESGEVNKKFYKSISVPNDFRIYTSALKK